MIFALLLSVFYPPIFFGIISLLLLCLNGALEFIFRAMVFLLAVTALVGIIIGAMVIL
jgi:hypothetical protein